MNAVADVECVGNCGGDVGRYAGGRPGHSSGVEDVSSCGLLSGT